MKYFTVGEKNDMYYYINLDAKNLIEYLYSEYYHSSLSVKRFTIQ